MLFRSATVLLESAKVVLNLRRLLSACALSVGVTGVVAQEPVDETTLPKRQQVRTVVITGQIGKKNIDEFRAAISSVTDDPLPAGLILFVDSPGGDGRAAMDLGRLARAHRAHIFVSRRCASACVFLLAGGVVRDALPNTIGIHRGRLTRLEPGKGVVYADTESDTNLRQLLALAEEDAREYFSQMGMPEQLFESMQKVPSGQTRMLSREEAIGLGLIGFNKDYLEERASALKARYNITKDQLVRRSAQMTSKCGEQIRTPANFTICYRRHLLAD